MGLFARLFNQWSPLDDRWYTNSLAPETKAGTQIDESSALAIPAVWACIRVIAETVASLPVHLYERLERGKNRAAGHPLYPLLHDKPNPEMSAMVFREAMTAHILSWGNCFAEKELDRMNRVKALWPIGPHRVTVYRQKDSGEIYYEVRLENNVGTKILSKNQMFHVPGLSFNGLYGYSPVTKFRESLGLTAATEEFGARYFGQGTHPGIVVSHPGRLSPEASKNLRESLLNAYSGLGQTHRLMLLEDGMKPEKIGIPPEESQFLQTRQFQLTEICRIFRVPPHMIYELSKATYSNIEHQSLEFVIHTLRPWLVRFEQAYNLQLLSDSERRRFFWEHLVDGLLRGDLKTRYEAYAIARNWGWFSANDICELENRNPLPDGKGDIYLVPLNMMEAGSEPPEPPAPRPAPQPEPPPRSFWAERRSDAVLLESFGEIFTDAVGQILSREANNLKRLLAKIEGEPDLPQVLKEFYRGDIRDFMRRKIGPVIGTFMKNSGLNGDHRAIHQEIEGFIEAHIEHSRAYITSPEELDGLQARAQPLAQEIMLAIIGRMRRKDHETYGVHPQ